jgi:hypothetical protein
MKKTIAAAMVAGMSVITLAAPASAAINPGSQVVNSGARNAEAQPFVGPHCHINLKSGAITGAAHTGHVITGNGEIFLADLDCDGTAG